MVGIAYNLDVPELDRLLATALRASRVVVEHSEDLNAIAAAIAENAAKQRISEDKRDPDGNPWELWKTSGQDRRPGHTILHMDGHLRDSIAGRATAQEAVVGSNLIYAAIHQLGGDTSKGHPAIPARPYLGLSTDDRGELTTALTDYLRDHL